MAVRDKSRLDKFKMLLASPSTDLGELASPGFCCRFHSCCLTHTWVTCFRALTSRRDLQRLAAWELQQSLAANVSSGVSLLWC